jgi:hypothetical protein
VPAVAVKTLNEAVISALRVSAAHYATKQQSYAKNLRRVD